MSGLQIGVRAALPFGFVEWRYTWAFTADRKLAQLMGELTFGWGVNERIISYRPLGVLWPGSFGDCEVQSK